MPAADRSFRIDGASGKGALIIHGLTGAPAEMKFLAKNLVRAGYTVAAPQLAGHCADRKALLMSMPQSLQRAGAQFRATGTL